MVITYYGAACFKMQSGETIIALAPPSKESKFKSPRFQTDIILINCNHPDYSGWESLSTKNENKPSFVASGPGEYEIGGIYLKGISAGNVKPFGPNTIYVLSFEDISFCHLGAFNEKSLDPDLKEEIGEVDILFVPLSEDDGQKAAQIITQIEPKVAIPMFFKENTLKQFLREFGNNSIKPVEKLTIKKKDLSEEKTQVIILSPVL